MLDAEAAEAAARDWLFIQMPGHRLHVAHGPVTLRETPAAASVNHKMLKATDVHAGEGEVREICLPLEWLSSRPIRSTQALRDIPLTMVVKIMKYRQKVCYEIDKTVSCGKKKIVEALPNILLNQGFLSILSEMSLV